MKNLISKFSMIGFVFTLLVQGCSTLGTLKGAEELVETGGKKHSLVKEKERGCAEQDEERLCVGMASKIWDLDVALRVAELDAKQSIVETIDSQIRVEGMRALSGPEKEEVGRFFETSLAWLTENVHISGIMLDRTYWEKWSKTNHPNISYYYRAYAIVRISNADYIWSRKQAINGLIDKAIREKNRSAELAARGVKKRLLQPGEFNE